ncbi:hypothetical protein I6F35_02925 [Bradyrhizobium sp. BRP22]|uniref:hypothetical protein n=1 Tax=Bradyrhizobium sp. BRP22 TaxID=2793821 RepID=UPI001CD4E12E|nr:hypothetical protein [Bradyrhizobium sp. BRP22]MCA1452168.1 hypothetical protein [Bradyrhizobium sp. BRP22]
MSELATRNGTEAAPAQGNFFTQYGEQASQRNIVGRLLKFSKGDYLVGEHNAEMPRGTELIANMDELMIGWIKWEDNKPAEQIMGRLADGYQPLKRKDLGDQDETQWERDDDGQPRDPWQFSNYLIMKTPGEDDPDDALFTFTTASKGGIGAIGELCKAYGKVMRQRPDEFPIVKLDVGSYAHSNKQFGRIKFPIFEIVGWSAKAEFAEALGQAAAAAAAEEKPKQTDIPF